MLPKVLIRRIYRRFVRRIYRRFVRRIYRPTIVPIVVTVSDELNLYRKYIAQGFQTKTILTYPEKAPSGSVLYKICRLLGYRITCNPKKNVDLIVNWEDTTFRRDYTILNELSKKQQVVNLRCKDISKRKVGHVHQAIFGYSLAVDPLTYTGLCVEKSNINGVHDGVVLQCPIKELDKERVYQILVNNRISDDYVEDIRVPVFGRTSIPFCYKKYRPVEDRFSNENTRSDLCDVDAVLSAEDKKLLLQFSAYMGLDYGELDVLRDVDTRKLYVVDVNNTPYGPPNHLDNESERRALERLSEEFKNSFMATHDSRRSRRGVASHLFSSFWSRIGNRD